MTPELLQTALARALARIAAARGLDSGCLPTPALRRPKEHEHGDWSSTIALRSAQTLHTDSRSLAEVLAAMLREDTGVAGVDVAGPGFLNITVAPDRLGLIAADIVTADRAFGPDAGTASGIDTTVSDRITADPKLQALHSTVGTDALRFAAARGISASVQLRSSSFLRRAHADNPVYFVQSAHAAACRLERRGVAAGIDGSDFDPRALTDGTETALLATLGDFLATTSRAASAREPQRITFFLETVAALFLDWAHACSVVPTIDEDITRIHASRLVLDRAAIIVLASGLRLLGASAPERM